MILEVFSLRDVKAQSFSRPFFCVNRQVALRDVAQLVAAGDSVVARFPGDYALYLLAVFDDVSGVFRVLDHHEFVCQCSDVVEQANVVPFEKEVKRVA